MGFIEIKKELIKLDKDKLIALFSDLYKNNKGVKQYLDFFTNPKEELLLEKYKAIVCECFYPKRGYNYSISNAKKAISEFKKLGTSTKFQADLMIFYVETGVEFTNEYGDIGESFYSSMESVFHQSLKLMSKEGILKEFETRAEKILKDTENIGWGFHDSMSYSFDEFYG
jgi:Family of unknown function (DUF6155)